MIYRNISKVHERADFSELIGKTIEEVKKTHNDGDCILFKCSDGSEYEMMHYSDCCEMVYVEDICGDLDDLTGVPVVEAEMVTNDTDSPNVDYVDELYMWTFYRIAAKGHVTIRWFGMSNGYYSVDVSFTRIKNSKMQELLA